MEKSIMPKEFIEVHKIPLSTIESVDSDLISQIDVTDMPDEDKADIAVSLQVNTATRQDRIALTGKMEPAKSEIVTKTYRHICNHDIEKPCTLEEIGDLS
jgi:hypothetical protein